MIEGETSVLAVPAVLIVDDYPPALRAFSAALESLDARLVLASSEAGAVQAIARETFAVVLLDVQLEGATGYDVARAIRSRDRALGTVTPIILLTARDQNTAAAAQGYETGAVDFLYKPVDLEVLRAKVLVFLELDRARRAAILEADRASEATVLAEELEARSEALERQMEEAQALAEELEETNDVLQRTLAEAEAARAAAEESERRFRENANAAPVFIWTAGPDAQCDWFNARWLDFTGRPLEAEIGTGWAESIHPDDLQRCITDYLGSFEARRTYTTEYRLRRYDGEYRWLLDTGAPRFAADGTFAGFVGSCIDITERKQAARELEMHFRVLESMREGVSVCNETGTIVYTNPAEDAMFGYGSGELVGQHVSVQNTYPPEENERIVGTVIAELQARGAWEGTWDNVRKDGTPFRTQARITAIQHDGQKFWVCVQEDVTERERAAARDAFLTDASRMLATSFGDDALLGRLARHCVPFLADYCSIDLLAENGEIQRAETAHVDPVKEQVVRELWTRFPYCASDRVGVPEALRTGRPQVVVDFPMEQVHAFVRDDAQLALLEQLAPRSHLCVPLLARGRAFGALSLVFSADSGRRYSPVDVQTAKELARRAATAIDNARLFREARQARASAEAANEAKSAFLAMMSHEFRTPLNAMIGYTQLLELGIAGSVSEQQREYLVRLDSSSRHLLTLVNDVLDLAKVDAGQLAIAHAAGVMGGAISSALAFVRPQAELKGVQLVDVADGGPGTPYVGDEDRVRQVLVNLLANAVKFTPPGGRVTIASGEAPEARPEARLGGAGPWAFVTVTDTGIGIDPEHHARIFDAFHQVETGEGGPYTRTAGGTGLGLTISRQLARLMGGDLTVESGPGVGAAFTLWLPAAAALRHESEPLLPEPIGHAGRVEAPVSPLQLRGLGEVGALLREATDDVLTAYVDRLQADPETPLARGMRRAEIEDHAPSLLADLAQSLVIVGEAGEQAAVLMRDGSAIQRTVATCHGLRRRAQGWTEEALHRDCLVLRHEVERAVREAVRDRRPAAGRDGQQIDAAIGVLGRLLERAAQLSVVSWRGTPGSLATGATVT